VGGNPGPQFAPDRAKRVPSLNWYLLSLATAALVTLNLFGLGADSLNFDHQKPGKPPAGWTLTATGASQQASRWDVLQDATAPSRPNVLEQRSTNFSENEFALAVFDKTTCRDADLSVKFKIAAGPRRIKSAGMVWRYQDPRNYYLLRFSVDEGNIALFRVQDGQMHAIPGAVRHDFQTDQWYVAKVSFRGSRFRILFGNRQLFDATDNALTAPGKTGLWTRAGTEASFDDFRLEKKG